MEVRQGDKVKIHYTGKLRDGTVFDSSVSKEPIQFVVGAGQVILGFDQGVLGMCANEKKTIEIPMDKAYGPHNENKVTEVDVKYVPDNVNPQVGQHLQLSHPDGRSFMVTVKAITEEFVTLDANHPLAGKDLIFDLELVGILENENA